MRELTTKKVGRHLKGRKKSDQLISGLQKLTSSNLFKTFVVAAILAQLVLPSFPEQSWILKGIVIVLASWVFVAVFTPSLRIFVAEKLGAWTAVFLTGLKTALKSDQSLGKSSPNLYGQEDIQNQVSEGTPGNDSSPQDERQQPRAFVYSQPKFYESSPEDRKADHEDKRAAETDLHEAPCSSFSNAFPEHNWTLTPKDEKDTEILGEVVTNPGRNLWKKGIKRDQVESFLKELKTLQMIYFDNIGPFLDLSFDRPKAPTEIQVGQRLVWRDSVFALRYLQERLQERGVWETSFPNLQITDNFILETGTKLNVYFDYERLKSKNSSNKSYGDYRPPQALKDVIGKYFPNIIKDQKESPGNPRENSI